MYIVQYNSAITFTEIYFIFVICFYKAPKILYASKTSTAENTTLIFVCLFVFTEDPYPIRYIYSKAYFCESDLNIFYPYTVHLMKDMLR